MGIFHSNQFVQWIGANLVQPESEFPEAPFLCGFSVVILVQIWLSPLL